MAKRKRITKNSVNARNDESVRIEQSGRNTCNYTPFLAIIIGLVVIIAILLTGGSQDSGNQSNSQPGQNIQNQPVLFTDIPSPSLKPEFAALFPDNISKMRRVKLLMDPLNEETGGLFASKVTDKASLLYISDSIETDVEIEYSVYKMQSPEAAAEVLNYYTTQKSWNTLPKKYGNFTFWLWQGYLEGQGGRPQGMFIYWDNLNNGAFLPIGRSGSYYISKANSDLLCLHGEAVKGNYFIMVDVHAPSWQVSEVADKMFAEAAKQINA